MAELKKRDASDIMVTVGGVIPQPDYEKLYAMGVAGIYGPGTRITKAAKELVQLLDKKLQE